MGPYSQSQDERVLWGLTVRARTRGSCGALQLEPGREGLVGPYSQSQDERVLWGLTVRARTRGSCGALQLEPGREGLVGPYSQSQGERVLWGFTVRAMTRGSCGALQSEPGQNGPLTELFVVVRLQVQLEDNTSKKYGKGIRESENGLIPFHEQHAK